MALVKSQENPLFPQENCKSLCKSVPYDYLCSVIKRELITSRLKIEKTEEESSNSISVEGCPVTQFPNMVTGIFLSTDFLYQKRFWELFHQLLQKTKQNPKDKRHLTDILLVTRRQSCSVRANSQQAQTEALLGGSLIKRKDEDGSRDQEKALWIRAHSLGGIPTCCLVRLV